MHIRSIFILAYLYTPFKFWVLNDKSLNFFFFLLKRISENILYILISFHGAYWFAERACKKNIVYSWNFKWQNGFQM
jgi:hypothetical protein